MFVARSPQMHECSVSNAYLKVLLAVGVKQDVLTRRSAELGVHGL
jgi:hypothetical protein